MQILSQGVGVLNEIIVSELVHLVNMREGEREEEEEHTGGRFMTIKLESLLRWRMKILNWVAA